MIRRHEVVHIFKVKGYYNYLIFIKYHSKYMIHYPKMTSTNDRFKGSITNDNINLQEIQLYRLVKGYLSQEM